MALASTPRRWPRLVALRALGLGDLLTAVPALRALARAFADHRRIVVAPHPLAPLVELLEPRWRLAPARGLGGLPSGIGQPELAVNLHGRGPQSHRMLLASRPRRLLAFRNLQVPESDGGPEWRSGEHEVERWCRLLREAGIEAERSDLGLPAPDVEIPDHLHRATVIHPGAASEARRWPPERWAAVAREEAAAGRTVVITGSPGERALAATVARIAELPDDASLAGETDLRSLAAVVAAADRVACGDTGVAHLATAFGTPSVVLFGPVPPAEWGPPAGDRHVALWTGNRGDPHARRPDPGLLAIDVETVIDALAALPTSAGAGSARRVSAG